MKYALLILSIGLFFCSCDNQPDKRLQIFQSTIKSFDRSSKIINRVTADTHKELFKRLNDVRYFNQSQIWHPVSVQVSTLSDSLVAYISDLKLQIIKKTGTENNSDALFNEGYYGVVNEIFIQQGKGEALYNHLKAFIDSIGRTDSLLITGMKQRIISEYTYLNAKEINSQEFVNVFFTHASAAATLCSLAKIENDIANIENEIIGYCFSMTLPGCDLHYETFQAIINQSSNYIMAGGELTISAGVGSFSVAAQPKFLVDNKVISYNDDGVMVYKFKTPLKAGVYSKEIHIEFYKPDGVKELKQYTIQYTVVGSNQNSK